MPGDEESKVDGEDSKGLAPSPRGNTGVVFHKNSLILIGGLDLHTTFNDIWSFNLETKVWAELETKGQIPTARGGHSTTIY